MDYGQPQKNFNQPPFFTAGVGNTPETDNPTQDQSLTAEVYSGEHDSRSLGNTAISSSEAPQTSTEVTSENQNLVEGVMSQITNLETPPSTETKIETTPVNTLASSKKTKLEEVAKEATNEFKQTGDAAKFVEEIQNLREAEK